MGKIKRFIECYIPVTQCNLKCEYCYIVKEGRRTLENPSLKYSPEHIRKALSIKRLGGTCFISICGGGETLIPDYIVSITHELLREGHVVNLTNNGTATKRIDQILNIDDKSLLKHLLFSFSFHYLELKNKNLLNVFFSNVEKVKKAGCSFYIKLNLYDGYIPYIDEIKKVCMERVGAYPQVAVSRKEICSTKFLMHTDNMDKYYEAGHSFDSPLFEFTFSYFMKKRKEFCYAGDWSFLLNLATGVMSKCYQNYENAYNIFENINKPIKFKAVGNNCKNIMCVNDCHFLALGVIPGLEGSNSYLFLRNRENTDWFTDEMKEILSSKLVDSNKELSFLKKWKINQKYRNKKFIKKLKCFVKKVLRFGR